MARRVDVYLHSDGVSENKGGAMVMVSAETDFSLHSSVLREFTKKVAMLAYAFNCTRWDALCEMAPELKEKHALLQSKEKHQGLAEKITIEKICIFHPSGEVNLGSEA